MRHAFAPLTLALMALLHGAPSWAGAGAGGVAVGIRLDKPLAAAATDAPAPLRPGACRSRSLDEPTQAGAEVTCASGEYASIQAFHSGMNFAWDAAPAAGSTEMRMGTVTIRRLFDVTQDGPDETWWALPLEMRVSF